MQSIESLLTLGLTRQETLSLWLKRNGLNQRGIALALNVQPNTVCRWFKVETIPTRRHRQLRGLGIPAELLPAAEDLTSGPRRAIPLPPVPMPASAAG